MDMRGLDARVCYEALLSRDIRFDGRFFVAVLTTGVYCRPSCRSRTPRPENVQFYASAEAAERAGFRACRRCRPQEMGPPERAEGNLLGGLGEAPLGAAVSRVPCGVAALANQLGWSPRHLQRLVGNDAGISPSRLLRFARLHRAVRGLGQVGASITDVALNAGFPSVRAFEEEMRRVYGLSPGVFRSRIHTDFQIHAEWAAGPALTITLAARGAFDAPALLRFLGVRAVPGLEEWSDADQRYRRVMQLAHGTAIAEIRAAADRAVVHGVLWLEDLADVPAAVDALRGLLDLDAPIAAIEAALAADSLLGPVVRQHPGLRVPGTVDGFELAVRAMLGQQVSVAAARTHTARLVERLGRPLASPRGSLRVAFPTAEQVAQAGPDLAGMALPAARRRGIAALAGAVAKNEVPPIRRGANPATVGDALAQVYGVGPWTRSYIALRALGDPDAFLAQDLGVRHALEHLMGRSCLAREIAGVSARWQPFRAYAVVHLWQALGTDPGYREASGAARARRRLP